MQGLLFARVWVSIVILIFMTGLQGMCAKVPPISAESNDEYVLYWLPYGVNGKSADGTRVFNVQTPNYAIDFDIDNTTFTRFASLPDIKRNAQPDKLSDKIFASASPAAMQMSVKSAGKEYRLCGWKNRNARLLMFDGGKFCYCIKIINLAFRADDGAMLPASGELVFYAWPDKVFITVNLTPKTDLHVDKADISLEFSGEFDRYYQVQGNKTSNGPLKTFSASGNLDMSSFYSNDGAGVAAIFSVPTDYELHKISAAIGRVKHTAIIYDKSSHSNQPAIWKADKTRIVSFQILGTMKDHVQACTADLQNECLLVDLSIIKSSSGQTNIYKGYQPRRGYYWIDNPDYQMNDNLYTTDINHTDRISFRLNNRREAPKKVRLMVSQEMGKRGIEGPVPILVDKDNWPTGLDVQVSKNWHGQVWYHAYTILNLKPKQSQDQSMLIAYQNWGNKPTVCHGQLSLVGYDTSMKGWNTGLNCQAWYLMSQGLGESICYDPTSFHCDNIICDMRPNFYPERKGSWWATNVGGGDFLAYYDTAGNKQTLIQPKIYHDKQSPCLADIDHVFVTPSNDVRQTVRTRSFSSSDMVRGIYNIRVDINKDIQFDRFSIFTLGAPRYNACFPANLAWGTVEGLKGVIDMDYTKEGYQTPGVPATSPNTWVALYNDPAPPGGPEIDGGANRGLILRSYKARIHGQLTSIGALDIRCLKGSTRPIQMLLEVNPTGADGHLQAGDYIEAEVEMFIYPKKDLAYAGSDSTMKHLLGAYGDSWQIPYWEARHNDIVVSATKGTVIGSYPLIVKLDANAKADFVTTGGMGLVPIEIRGYKDYRDIALQQWLNGKWETVDQSVLGKDFWQAQYDSETRTYTGVFNIPVNPMNEDRCKNHFRVGR